MADHIQNLVTLGGSSFMLAVITLRLWVTTLTSVIKYLDMCPCFKSPASFVATLLAVSWFRAFPHGG